MFLPNENLSKNLTYYRKKQKTQKELATITGVRQTHIGDIENGKSIRIYTLARLVVGLGVTMDELVGRR